MGEVIGANFGSRSREVRFEVGASLGEGQREQPRANLFHHEVMRPLMKALDPFAQRTADRLIRQAVCEGWAPSKLTTELSHATGLPRKQADTLGRTGVSVAVHN